TSTSSRHLLVLGSPPEPATFGVEGWNGKGSPPSRCRAGPPVVTGYLPARPPAVGRLRTVHSGTGRLWAGAAARTAPRPHAQSAGGRPQPPVGCGVPGPTPGAASAAPLIM